MHTASELPRDTRAFIVLLALAQGGLMYLAQHGQEAGWWPLASLDGQVAWYTLVLTIPTLLALSVVHLRDRQLWLQTAACTFVFGALALHAAWQAAGATGLATAPVLMPFAASIAVAAFVLLPWLQGRLALGHWRTPYPALFESAWQNALTLALAGLFTGICWLVLQLWAGLFALVEITFFRSLFRQDAFIHLATGTMFGLGVLIGRTQQRPVQVARQILFAIFKGLLPLLAFIAVLFVASLPFTGLAPLWSTRSAASLLLVMVGLMVVFINAVFQDGRSLSTYSAWLRRLVEAGLLVMPVYAALALAALWLRIAQYGWTAERVLATVLAVLAACYALGYAWSVLRPRGPWLHGISTINRALSWAVISVALALNTPLLDPHRIAVNSQIQRLDAGHISADALDLEYLRFGAGRRGHAAAQALQTHPAFADPDQQERLTQVLARVDRWGHRSPEPGQALDEAALRAHIQLADGHADPGPSWWQTLLATSDPRHDAPCRYGQAPCVLLTLDLDGDGDADALLCEVTLPRSGLCLLYTRHGGQWRQVGQLPLWRAEQQGRETLLAALRAGRISAAPRRWPDVRIGDGAPISVDPGADCLPAATSQNAADACP